MGLTAHSKGAGLQTFHTSGVGSTAINVKSSPGQLFGVFVTTSGTGYRNFVAIYNDSSAATSADTPKLVLGASRLAPVTWYMPNGILFTSGISVRGVASGDGTSNGNTSQGIVVNMIYA